MNSKFLEPSSVNINHSTNAIRDASKIFTHFEAQLLNLSLF